MKPFYFLFSILFFLSCSTEKIPADLLVKNGKVYTVNKTFDTVSSFAVKDGKILETGTAEALQNKYEFKESYDAQGNTIVPGLIDAHAHFFNLGLTLQQVDLVGTKSFEEVQERVIAFQTEKPSAYILGRGWDQNDWETKEFPTNEELDSLFPDMPVALSRIDGHAYLANSKALELAGITSKTKLPGGEVVLENGEPTGILIDSPMELIDKTIPEITSKIAVRALKDAEKICLQLGLTTVDDAGLDRNIIELIDSLQQNGELKIRIYAMVSNTAENLDYYLKRGIYKTERLNVRSVKVYSDGALGSRGAALREPYSDKPGHFGAMITPAEELKTLASKIVAAGFQMNTHAIGDSANVAVLRAYKEVLKGKENKRWRVEHAQVISPESFGSFSKNIIPSVQPTHATSDMYWAEDRLGHERIKGAYAYKTLLDSAGILALGTDFPVEHVNPMYTFYAAVARRDLKQEPEGGYRMDEALTREEALKGMTLWAAYANFEETEKGSLEAGKAADFVVLNQDILQAPENDLPQTKALATFIAGERVYLRE